MSQVGFEPTNSAGERPQTYALERATTGTGIDGGILLKFVSNKMRGCRMDYYGLGLRSVAGFCGHYNEPWDRIYADYFLII